MRSIGIAVFGVLLGLAVAQAACIGAFHCEDRGGIDLRDRRGVDFGGRYDESESVREENRSAREREEWRARDRALRSFDDDAARRRRWP